MDRKLVLRQVLPSYLKYNFKVFTNFFIEKPDTRDVLKNEQSSLSNPFTNTFKQSFRDRSKTQSLQFSSTTYPPTPENE